MLKTDKFVAESRCILVAPVHLDSSLWNESRVKRLFKVAEVLVLSNITQTHNLMYSKTQYIIKY